MVDVRKALAAQIDKAGSQTNFAAQHGLSEGYVSDVVRGERQAGPKILRALGLESQTTYRRKSK